MTVKSATAWSGLFVCKDATGALATPSVGPVGALYVDGTVNGASVTVSGSNPYKWTVTLPTLTAGQTVSMYITATIATIATASIVAEDVADTVRMSDTLTANVTQIAGQTANAAAPVTFPASIGTSTLGGTAQTGDAYAVVTNATYGNSALHADIAVLGGGAGALTVTITVTDGTNPVDGAEVWVSTDNPATNVVAGTKTTDALGKVVFMLDAGTYYLWRQAAGVDFVNPETIIVS